MNWFLELFKEKDKSIEFNEFILSLKENNIPQDIIIEALYIIKMIMREVEEVDEARILNKTIKTIENWKVTEVLTEEEWKAIYTRRSKEIEKLLHDFLIESEMCLEEQTQHIEHFHPDAIKSEYVMTHVIAEGIHKFVRIFGTR